MSGPHGRPSQHLAQRLAITTSGKESPALEAEAAAAALASGVPYLRRGPGQARGTLLGPSFDALIVFEVNRISLVARDGTLGFAAGLAHLRIKQLEAGTARDRLVDVAAFAPGDRVLDCTLGLAADAQVAAWAVGRQGKVVGLESSVALYLLSKHGLGRLRRPQAAAPIEVQHTDAEAFLRTQATGAFDVVLLDPMFGHPRKASPAFELLRQYADHTPLGASVLAEARRVAKRAVVVKGPGGAGDLERLGLVPVPGRRGARVEWTRL